MDRHDYDVHWVANGLDFRYSGTKKVWATDETDAKTRAITAVSREMCMARQLIKIESVERV